MRKQPKQQRAKELVNRILQATERYIAQHGVQEITTPKISEQSGVGVGSIYQYFNNKQEIIESLMEHKSHELGRALREYILNHDSLELSVLVADAIEFGFQQLQNNNGFYVQIIRHWHELNTQKSLQILQQHFYELWVNIFGRFYQDHSAEVVGAKTFIIISSTVFSMMNYFSQQPEMFDQGVFKQELIKMVTTYLNQ